MLWVTIVGSIATTTSIDGFPLARKQPFSMLGTRIETFFFSILFSFYAIVPVIDFSPSLFSLEGAAQGTALGDVKACARVVGFLKLWVLLQR